MKYFFIVQGEGRGHMTQAISLSQILRNAGHEIVHVVVGKSPQRNIPSFFFEQIHAPVTLLESPNFVTDKQHKSVKPLKTAIVAMAKNKRYRNSIKQIHELVTQSQPDVIVNFYDFLGGLFNRFYKPKAKFICLAHQYLIHHKDFTFPKGRYFDKLSLKIGNRITALGADRILALSFQPFADEPKKKIYVVPPLLRDDLKSLSTSTSQSLLAYMVNPGYAEEVMAFKEKFPNEHIDCFWDKKDQTDGWSPLPGLVFHQLDDKKFLDKMAHCKAYVSTAGFESICEAMYLGKPVMMVPVAGHYEQACNAVDAVKAGAGITAHAFHIELLHEYLPLHKDITGWFKPWVHRNVEMFVAHLTS